MTKNTIKHCTKLFFHKNTIKHCTKLFFHKNTIKHCTKLFFHKNTITHSTKICFHKNNTKYCTKFCYYKNTIKHCSQFFFHKINKNMQRKLGVKHFCTSKGMTSLTPNSKLCNFITLWKLIKPQQNFVLLLPNGGDISGWCILTLDIYCTCYTYKQSLKWLAWLNWNWFLLTNFSINW